jgi:hypothetical protein
MVRQKNYKKKRTIKGYGSAAIISYASEIWISDFTQKELKGENLPFEKIHNHFCKYLLGVYKKSSNFASRRIR